MLTVITAVVIAASIVQLSIRVALSLITNEQDSYWLGDGLIRILGDLLTVLIALEVLQNITSYLRRHVVQIDLVLVTALTAVARKAAARARKDSSLCYFNGEKRCRFDNFSVSKKMKI